MMKLCCDFSHWTCVLERLFNDQFEIIQQCAHRALHIHARVGYEEGPQVSDPRAPEFEHHLHTFEKWWDEIWASQKSRGLTESTLTPEYGPPGYMHTLPYTNDPVSNLWDICNWQAKRAEVRFKENFD